MKIAVAANGNTLDALVSEVFEGSACLLIVETDDSSYEVYQNPELQNGFGLAMTERLIEKDCEALISGTIEEPAFVALVKAQVTRYFGAGLTARDTLHRMDAGQLEFIRECNGKEWVPHDHSEGTCSCGESEG